MPVLNFCLSPFQLHSFEKGFSLSVSRAPRLIPIREEPTSDPNKLKGLETGSAAKGAGCSRRG